METKQAITPAIALYRGKHDGMTLAEFGKLFTPPVDKSTVSRWERGQISPKRAVLVERVTGIPRHALLPEVFGSPVTEAAE
ncbi:helix-turn-helix domain-containing protein [Sinorhizobium meliloti]|nr:helix-turn-helix domain-containing protein [Sinorhizobium meliloti]